MSSSKLSKRDFSCMPEELLELIFSRLKHSKDVFRFESVCKSWKSAARSARSQHQLVPKLSPMITCSSSFLGSKSYKVCNSTQGWLVTTNYGNFHSTGLVNPLSGSFIRLPSLVIVKAVASCSPLNPDCTILAITKCKSRLMYCKPHEGIWRQIKNENSSDSFVDIVCCKKYFFVARKTGEIMVCVKKPEPKLVKYAPSVTGWDRYFIETLGNFREVTICGRWEMPHILVEKMGLNQCLFKVLKPDFLVKKWTAMRSLEENSLLWNVKHYLLVSSEEFPEFKSNCLYLFDPQDQDDKGGCFLIKKDMKTGKCESILNLPESASSYFWFTPDVTTSIKLPFCTDSSFTQGNQKNLICLENCCDCTFVKDDLSK